MGNILKLIRISLDLSVKEVSGMMNVSSTYICDIESGKKKMSLNMLEGFSKCYNIPVSKIISLNEKRELGITRNKLLIEILEYYIGLEENKTLSK